MTTNADLLEIALRETIACQDEESPEFRGRRDGAYPLLGAFLPARPGGGQCATTDLAMDAIARLADGVRDCDPALRRGLSRASVRRETSAAFADLLPDLAGAPPGRPRWLLLRARILERLAPLAIDLVHYIPVWLFVGQDCDPVEVGPVRFVRREDWPAEIARRRGSAPAWLDAVHAIWAGDRRRIDERGGGGGRPGGSEAAAPDQSGETPAEETAEQMRARHDAERVARGAHPDQWIACVEIRGFEEQESRRRAVLAARAALDAFRLLMPDEQRSSMRTSVDHAAPAGVDRFRQAGGGELRWGGSVDRPGVSGSDGLAREVVSNGADVLLAAGECIRQACDAMPADASRLPRLSERWFDALHWFGRACLADVDYVAVVFAAISLDVLSGGKEEWGIADLISSLTGHPRAEPALRDGTSLEKLVGRVYKLRSGIAHGSVLAVHDEQDVERTQLQDLAAVALREYVLVLGPHAAGGGGDGRDAFAAGLARVSAAKA